MDKPLKDWTLEEIQQECERTLPPENGNKCFDVCKVGYICSKFFNVIVPEEWCDYDGWNKTP